MKRRFALLALCAFTLVLVPGCNSGGLIPPTDPVEFGKWLAKNKVTIVELVRTGAEFGTDKGLTAWAKKNPTGAKEASLALSKNISEQIMPYFKDGSKLPTAAEVKQLLASSLFKNVPDEVKLAIIAASAVLDFYCPIPNSDTYLTPDQRDVVCAFFEGVRLGCDDFNEPTVKTRTINKKVVKLPKSGWLE
jgi:hypothetical protein